jgi:transposase
MSTPDLYVGIDVAKDSLESALTAGDQVIIERFTQLHDDAGLVALVEALRTRSVKLVVLEPSGGLERDVVASLAAAEIPVVVINGRRIRYFARSLGLLAKTDKIDASVLAIYAELIQPAVRQLPTEEVQELDALTTRRRQVIEMINMERSRFSRAKRNVAPKIQQHINYLTAELKDAESEIQRRIEASELWQAECELLLSTPGVGPVLASTILAELPELGHVSKQLIARLVGVAPINCDTGKYRGTRRIQGGRAAVRSTLYMAVSCGRRWNPVLRDLYERHRAVGKPHKVAMVACMRKLIIILNAMLRDSTSWQQQLRVPQLAKTVA